MLPGVWSCGGKAVSLWREKKTKKMAKKKEIDYLALIEQEQLHSDIVGEPQYDLFFNNENEERREERTLFVY